MSKLTRNSLLAAVLLLVPVVGQGRTYVVDAKRGRGSQFADLPAAIQAAAHGDRLVVRKGHYSSISLAKGVSIIGEAGVAVGVGSNGSVIGGLPAGKTATLQLLTMAGGLSIRRCAGRVVLDRVTSKRPIDVEESPIVFLRNCSFSQLVANRGGVQVVGGTIGGIYAYEPVQLTQSVVGLSGCSVKGSAAMFWTWAAVWMDATSELTITGGANTSIVSGGAGFPNAVVGDGRVIVDPRVTVRPGYDPTVKVTTRTVPFVKCSAAPLGGQVNVTLSASAGSAYFLAGGVYRFPWRRPAFDGSLFLDPGRSVVVANGVLGVIGRVFVSIPVPKNPALLGMSYAWQGLAGPVAGPLTLSNPAVHVHGL